MNQFKVTISENHQVQEIILFASNANHAMTLILKSRKNASIEDVEEMVQTDSKAA